MEESKQDNKKNMTSNKNFIIFYILFVIVLLIFTTFAFLFTINFLSIKGTFTWIEEIKESSNDTKYVIGAYSDTYNTNAIKIVNYYDIDGNVSEQYPESDNFEYRINYIQINGLKDEKIQNKINETLKNKAYEIKDKYVISEVNANFSNMLSIYISSWNDDPTDTNSKYNTYNVNLATGNEIKLEELFVSSAPINSFIADGLYELLAWSNLRLESSSGIIDMNTVNTSDYEDKFLTTVNKYKKNKNNLKYTFNANTVSIYDLVDKSWVREAEYPTYTINIDLIKYIDSVAMYKKFLTDESIFKDDKLALKEIVVFTEPPYSEYTTLNYGMLQTNIFIEDMSAQIVNRENDQSAIMDKIIKLSEENKSDLLNNNDRSLGVFCQRFTNFNIDDENDFLIIYTSTSKATCPIDYFMRNAFLDYIKMKSAAAADVSLKLFTPQNNEMYPNLNITYEDEEWYYNKDTGELLGKTLEEATKKKNEIIEKITNSTPAPEGSVTVQSIDETNNTLNDSVQPTIQDTTDAVEIN